ncbi:MAG: hypothetical protein K0Q95_1228 [Bacteroidota bacterium]|jgi:hypothetical protein|nr:hypothetical protein [Bacteroidota bacterium]
MVKDRVEEKTTQATLQNTGVVTEKDTIPKAILDPAADIADSGRPYQLDSLSLNSDTLSVFVNYSGGCEKHTFQLISNGMYAKSMPPQLSLCLKHSANDDHCRQQIMQELKFDVSGLRYKGSHTVILKLSDKNIRYSAK